MRDEKKRKQANNFQHNVEKSAMEGADDKAL